MQFNPLISPIVLAAFKFLAQIKTTRGKYLKDISLIFESLKLMLFIWLKPWEIILVQKKWLLLGKFEIEINSFAAWARGEFYHFSIETKYVVKVTGGNKAIAVNHF